jgi:hypothetical protein
MLASDETSENWNNISLHPPLVKKSKWFEPKLVWYQLILIPASTAIGTFKKNSYQSGTDINLDTDFGQVYAWYIDWYATRMRLVLSLVPFSWYWN